MSNKTSSTRAPQRVHLHAYERLRRLCAEIQRGRYPTKAALAEIVERSPRTVQNDLRALVNDFDAPLEFDRVKNGFYFTDPAWRLSSIALTQGELISFFAAERMLRRLGAASEVQLARSAVRRLAALLPQEVVVDLGALEEAMSFAPEPVLDVSPEMLRKLATAAMRRQTLHIHYYSQYRAEYSERDVDVLLLHNSLGEWYAICYDHNRQAMRDFHAGRIIRLSETRRTFTPPADWDAQAYLQRGFGMFRCGQDVVVEVEEETHTCHACESFGGYSLHFSVSLVPTNIGVKLSFPSGSATHLSGSVRAARLVYPTDRYRGSATRACPRRHPRTQPSYQTHAAPYPSVRRAGRHWPF